MGANDHLLSLARALRGATGFAQAAQVTAEAVLDLCDAAVVASPFVGRAQITRALIHVRPGDGYTRIAARGLAGRAPQDATSELADVAPSASAYRWVEEHQRPIAIDVHLGLVTVFDGAHFVEAHARSSQAFDSQASRKGLLGRHVTHLLSVPLRAPSGAMIGMISVEAAARAAMGTPFIWPDVAATAHVMTDLAAAHLLAHPAPLEQVVTTDRLLPVIGASMQCVTETLRVFAQQEETILLSGPTGAGKSRLARWCHEQSRRAKQAFEVLDLASISENLRLAELFGWRRGSFTGAIADNPGAVGRVNGGTLFIDEIDKLSMEVQASLLRLLEERTYRVLGEPAGDRTSDVRFVIGTNRELWSLVRAGQFREDLYYRIHVLPVRVPPLADRRDEIAAWATYMLARRHGDTKGPAPVLSEAARRELEAYPWPGNLRQLDNTVRRAYALFLVEHRGASSIAIEARHIERALAYEGAQTTGSFVELLHAAATAFVVEAERRGWQAPLKLDLTLAIQGLVMGAAVQKLGSVDEAFRLFGLSSLVQHRNHFKVLRRELKRVAGLYAVLGAGPSPFEGLVHDGDG